MDYGAVYQYFLDSDFDVQPIEHSGQSALALKFEVPNQIVTLIHFHVDELQALPHFYLQDYKRYGTLAHIQPSQQHSELGSICVNNLESVSVNFERPELAFEESFKRHIGLLKSVMEDSVFNQQELMREFSNNWHTAAINILNKSVKWLYISTNGAGLEQLDVYLPARSGSLLSIPSSHVALPATGRGAELASFFGVDQRKRNEHASCFVIPLDEVPVTFPDSAERLRSWFIQALDKVSERVKDTIEKKLLGLRAKEFLIVASLPTPLGTTWFGVRLFRDHKKPYSGPHYQDSKSTNLS